MTGVEPAYYYQCFFGAGARAMTAGSLSELTLRERLCSDKLVGLSREQTMLNYEAAREARFQTEQQDHDARYHGVWQSRTTRNECEAIVRFARSAKIGIGDAEIQATIMARRLALAGLALGQAFTVQVAVFVGLRNDAWLQASSPPL